MELIESDSSSLFEISEEEYNASTLKQEEVCIKPESHEASENSSTEKENSEGPSQAPLLRMKNELNYQSVVLSKLTDLSPKKGK